MVKDILKCLYCKHYDKYAIVFTCDKYGEIPEEIIEREKDCELYEDKDD